MPTDQRELRRWVVRSLGVHPAGEYWHRPNPALGDKSPRKMELDGNIEPLYDYLRNLKNTGGALQ